MSVLDLRQTAHRHAAGALPVVRRTHAVSFSSPSFLPHIRSYVATGNASPIPGVARTSPRGVANNTTANTGRLRFFAPESANVRIRYAATIWHPLPRRCAQHSGTNTTGGDLVVHAGSA